ncbi:MAG: hypothetical protein JNJ59_06945, partial [Deltaproteobacteria bacterium]|nr:hypothetical protein [Deltaproteobacteria bacterium]
MARVNADESCGPGYALAAWCRVVSRRSRGLVVSLVALMGCAGEGARSLDADAEDVVEVSDTTEVGEEAEVAPVCGEVTLTLTGNTWPGETVELEVRGADDAAWKFEGLGSIYPQGLRARWTFYEGSAVHVPETARVSVAAVRPGCEPVVLEREVVVDWPDARRTVVLTNPSVPGSDTVAKAYAAWREIPEAQICAVASPDRDELAGEDYERWLGEVLACVDRVGPHVHFVVPVYGVPYKVRGRIADIVDPTVKVTTSLDALLAFGRGSASFGLHAQNPYYQRGDSRT